ncbi:hypothetical protein [Rodentibacter caecimuris]|uniref:hypothetical protein n=1 Tax=Rodentibacter caecimuris TaxID=1796644 RepID=UPI00258A0ACD|nr:hypothetical protein [Rodentibacter heylii]
MDKKQIYYDLGYSIRKTNNDEIEIRHSFLSGFYRGVFRFLIIGFFIINAFLDARIDKLSYKQKMQKFARVIQRQKELNERLLAQGLHNEVNNDWDEKETSPALKNTNSIYP